MDEFKGFLNLILLIVFVAASVLGPVVERWRKRKEKERRAQQASPAAPEAEPEADVEPSPPASGGPRLPYEDVLHELFGPYIERRKREAEEAQRREEAEAQAEAEAEEVEEVEVVEEPPARPPALANASTPQAPAFQHVEVTVPRLPTATAGHRALHRTLDEIVFRNPRLSPGAKLVLASEILGKPRALRR